MHATCKYGSYIRAVCRLRVNFSTPVRTAVHTGVKNAPVYTGRKYGP